MNGYTKRKRPIDFDRLDSRQLLTLVVTPISVTATVNAPFDGVVATLVDTTGHDSPSSFTTTPGGVSIEWTANGPTTAGTVVGPIYPGVFEIEGEHTYTSGGPSDITISVADQSGNDANASGTVNVTSQPPILTIAPNVVTGTVGDALPGSTVVATFLDTNQADVQGDFQALITWGDGNSSVGTVSGGNGSFEVMGSNTYAAAGTYPTNVTVFQVYTGESVVTNGTANIGDSVPVTATGTTLSATPGAGFTTQVATFTDSNAGASASNIVAVIDWGDGQTSKGVVSAGAEANTYAVTGSHEYSTTTAAGQYAVTVMISDPNGQATASSTVLLLVPTIAVTGTTFGVQTVPPGTGTTPVVVARFSDNNSSANATNISAIIDWGDGESTSGEVSGPDVYGIYTVTGTPVYSSLGVAASYSVTVTVIDPSGLTGMATSTAQVVVSGPGYDLVGSLGTAGAGVFNGPNAGIGYTNTNRPTFTGSAAPYAVIQMYGRDTATDAQIPLGQAVANASGFWTFTSGPLAVGKWQISATATPPGGFPSNPVMLTTGDPKGENLVYVDLVPKATKRPHPAVTNHLHRKVTHAKLLRKA